MATYKLIQDIEAEDHILGPLTLRQFIFALIAVFCFYMSFLGFTRPIYPLLIFLPPALFFGFFAVPFGRDQPTEVWFLAKLRFWFKPRKRIWDQSGIKELVTITAPRKVERVLTNGLNQNEVQSRLSALANTLDTRGWAIKNVGLNAYAQPNPMMAIPSDRLIDISNIPQEVPNYEVHASDDMLDESNNPVAQQFTTMITQSAQARRQHMLDVLRSDQPVVTQQAAAPQPDYWFMDPARGTTVTPDGQVLGGGTSQPSNDAQAMSPADEAALSDQLKQNRSTLEPTGYGHTKVIQPLNMQASVDGSQSAVVSNPIADNSHATTNDQRPTTSTPSPATPDPDILNLAHNDDLNVATLARQASKHKDDESSQEEVVISLH